MDTPLVAAFTRKEDDAALERLLTRQAQRQTTPVAQAADAFVKGVLYRISAALADGDPTDALEADLDALKYQLFQTLGV